MDVGSVFATCASILASARPMVSGWTSAAMPRSDVDGSAACRLHAIDRSSRTGSLSLGSIWSQAHGRTFMRAQALSSVDFP
jgi:hypothetical protein